MEFGQYCILLCYYCVVDLLTLSLGLDEEKDELILVDEVLYVVP
jgi:hypothetical protein